MKKPAFAVIECEHHWDLETNNVSFSPDGGSILGFVRDRREHFGIARWDTESGKVLEHTKQKRKDYVEWIVPSDDRTRIAVRFGEKLVMMDAKSLKEKAAMKGYFGGLSWARDGKRIVTVYGDDATVWDTATGRSKARQTFKRGKGSDSLAFAGFSNNGEQIIIGRYSGIYTWDLRTGETT